MGLVYSSQKAAQMIIEAASTLSGHGWTPATSSNFSVRLNGERCAITVSGKDKGKLGPADVMLVDMNGQSLTDQTPSAETQLHTRRYRADSDINVILHAHTPTSIRASALARTDRIEIQNQELIKAFHGNSTHENRLTIPVFDNSQDIATLAETVEMELSNRSHDCCYLIRGHGSYVWGENMQEALRHMEGLEALLDYWCWEQDAMSEEG